MYEAGSVFTVSEQVTAVIPEPSTAGCLFAGLAALAAWCGVKRKWRSSRSASLVAALAAALTPNFARGEDPVAALAHRIEKGSAQLAFDSTYGYLPALLDALQVPVESQMKVFSKTSIQALSIQPSNPRVLYFNDSEAVGWVRSGFHRNGRAGPRAGNRVLHSGLQRAR